MRTNEHAHIYDDRFAAKENGISNSKSGDSRAVLFASGEMLFWDAAGTNVFFGIR